MYYESFLLTTTFPTKEMTDTGIHVKALKGYSGKYIEFDK